MSWCPVFKVRRSSLSSFPPSLPSSLPHLPPPPPPPLPPLLPLVDIEKRPLDTHVGLQTAKTNNNNNNNTQQQQECESNDYVSSRRGHLSVDLRINREHARSPPSARSQPDLLLVMLGVCCPDGCAEVKMLCNLLRAWDKADSIRLAPRRRPARCRLTSFHCGTCVRFS
ncbi:hypothetical protein E2C01_002350 [Portunus trituberculatus]|uniref:Uncharacterized protein n=1 Tax=Portunus trituberculatus TaxID=210409 RepID=A0A5B7CLQ3_PORTR|nr:hypothetical protein [Portunus trituberculatus]